MRLGKVAQGDARRYAQPTTARVPQVEVGAGIDDDWDGGGAGRLARRPNAVGSVSDITDRRSPVRRPVFKIDPGRTARMISAADFITASGVSP